MEAGCETRLAVREQREQEVKPGHKPSKLPLSLSVNSSFRDTPTPKGFTTFLNSTANWAHFSLGDISYSNHTTTVEDQYRHLTLIHTCGGTHLSGTSNLPTSAVSPVSLLSGDSHPSLPHVEITGRLPHKPALHSF